MTDIAKIETGHKISVVIPTYQREEILVDTIGRLLRLDPGPDEILIVDQTKEHLPKTTDALTILENQKKIRWLRLPKPSIPGAMNVGILHAHHDVLLFLDDDIIPGQKLISAHMEGQEECNIVAGHVLQPWDASCPTRERNKSFKFSSTMRQHISEFLAGNFSIKRMLAIKMGGFDENFLGVAYRFESEFAERAVLAGEKILFEPNASIRHLKEAVGGTRSYGHHLTSIRPHHSVGEYYFIMRSPRIKHKGTAIISRFFSSVTTKHHLHHPWWVPTTLLAELMGFMWAIFLAVKGPKFMDKI